MYKKFGLGISTEKKFRKIFGVNLKNKKLVLHTDFKIEFNKLVSPVLKGKKLFKNTKKNIDFQKFVIKSYIGTRHKRNYPVRGQRTHTNATKKVFKRKKF